MKATLTQLAWYIERGELRCTAYRADGGRRYEGVFGLWVEIHALDIDALDAERDRVFQVLHRRNAKENR